MEGITKCPFLNKLCYYSLVCIIFYVFIKAVDNFLKLFRQRRDLKDFGKWAVITGASDGIGKAIAAKLYGLGLNLVLISRSKNKLETTAKEIQEGSVMKQEIRILPIDFGALSGNLIYDQLEVELQNLDVGLLVNNVGISYPYAMYYNEIETSLIEDLISVNLRSVLRMTHIVYNGMRKRKRGAIICVGSGASEIPSEPLYAAYVAVKGGIEAFCRSLQVESQSSNILIQCHTPLLVATKLSKCRTASLTILSAERYAERAITAIQKGKCGDNPTISPSYVHMSIIWLSNMLPRFLWNSLRMSQTQSIRQKALHKKHM